VNHCSIRRLSWIFAKITFGGGKIILPTIEIISFERQKPINIDRSKYNFAIRQNSKLVSHRALFQDFLNINDGVILHIGNLKLAKEQFFFFASELIDWKFEEADIAIPIIDRTEPFEEQWNGDGQMQRFKFKQSFIYGIDSLLKKALNLSPIKKCGFLTDVQFGPKFSSFIQLNTIEEFWNIHNSSGLVWNAIYIIHNF